MEPKPDRLQQFDIAGLKLAYQSIAGIVAQLADIAQDSEPGKNLPAACKSLSEAMEFLSNEIAYQSAKLSFGDIEARVEEMLAKVRERPDVS